MDLEPVTYHVDRRGAIKTVLFFLALGLLPLLMLLIPEDEIPRTTLVVVLSLLLVISLTLASLLLHRLYSDEPYIVLDARGIYDNASGDVSGAGWIGWDEVADVRLSTYQGHPCVEVVLTDREEFVKEHFGLLGRFNRPAWLGYPAVAFRGPLLPVEPEVLVEEIRSYRRRATGASFGEDRRAPSP